MTFAEEIFKQQQNNHCWHDIMEDQGEGSWQPVDRCCYCGVVYRYWDEKAMVPRPGHGPHADMVVLRPEGCPERLTANAMEVLNEQ